MRLALLLFIFLILDAPRLFAEKAVYEAQAGLINVGGFVVFYNSQGPLSYNTLTPGDIPKESLDAGEIQCESCQYGISIPFVSSLIGSRNSSVSGALGDGGFRKALKNLQRERPELRGIYDVKVDVHKVNILGVYKKVCMEVSARGFK